MNVRDLKFLVNENMDLIFIVEKTTGGFIVIVETNSGRHVLVSQRGGSRIFRTLDTVYSFLQKMNANNFKVLVNNG